MARAWHLEEVGKPVFSPTTLVLDPSGTVRFSHVGKRASDRPQLASILAALDQIAN